MHMIYFIIVTLFQNNMLTSSSDSKFSKLGVGTAVYGRLGGPVTEYRSAWSVSQIVERRQESLVNQCKLLPWKEQKYEDKRFKVGSYKKETAVQHI
jgi:hypothetical protein